MYPKAYQQTAKALMTSHLSDCDRISLACLIGCAFEKSDPLFDRTRFQMAANNWDYEYEKKKPVAACACAA